MKTGFGKGGRMGIPMPDDARTRCRPTETPTIGRAIGRLATAAHRVEKGPTR